MMKSFIEAKMFKIHKNLWGPLQVIIKHEYCVTISNIKTLKISTSYPMMSSAIWKIFYEFLIFCDFFHKPLGIRISHSGVFCKKDVLRIFVKFTGKNLCQSLFFNKVAGLRNMAYFPYFPYSSSTFNLSTYFFRMLFAFLLPKHSIGAGIFIYFARWMSLIYKIFYTF